MLVTLPDPHVSGWRPDFRPADEKFGRQSVLLRALIGRRLLESWTVRFVGDDRFADLPIVLRFDDGAQMEACWENLDDLSLTWNTIDLGTTPHAWVDDALEWRRDTDDALTSVAGGIVTDVLATRFLFETRNAFDQAERSAVWLTTGLWLATDRGDLHMFNALDENGVTAERPERDATHDWRAV